MKRTAFVLAIVAIAITLIVAFRAMEVIELPVRDARLRSTSSSPIRVRAMTFSQPRCGGRPAAATTAIATSSGAAWTQTAAGRAVDFVPFNGGTYAIVITPATTTGGTATRSLVAISDAGAVPGSINV